MKSGAEIIAEERKRQIEVEGWTSEKDDLYTSGQLALAGATYAIPMFDRDDYGGYVYSTDVPIMFPLSPEWWKPTPDDRIRELAKAGALTKREYDSYEGSLNELLLTTISLVSWQNVVLIFLKSSLFEKMAAFSPVLIPAPSIHSMSMPKVWMNCLIRLLRKTKGCLKKKLIKPGKKWVLHYSNPQNNYKNE